MIIYDFETGLPTTLPGEPAPKEQPPKKPEKGHPIPREEFKRRARQVDWIVDGRIAARGVTILAGQPKRSFKTVQLLRLVECVGAGLPWLGRAARQRPAVFIGFEGGEDLIALRLTEVQDPEAELVQSHYFYGVDGYDWCIATLCRAVKLGRKWSALIAVDTLSQVLAIKGIDENDNMAVTNYLREIDDLVSRTDSAIVFSHHFAKYNFQMRGASAIAALCNWCEITAAKTDARRAVAEQTDASERLLRLDWSLRHGPSGADALKISKPNGAFAFDTVALSDLPRATKSDNDERLGDAIAARLRATPGQPVTVGELAAAAHATLGGRRPSDRQIQEVCVRLRETHVPVYSAKGVGSPSWVWGEQSEAPHSP